MRVRQKRLEGAEGFVIPAVIFSLLLMSTLAVAALLTAQDEQKSSRAIRESVAAMYAAEAGLNEVWATWDDTLVDNLNPGDSLDLGWSTLPHGSSYRAVIHRFDNGGQEMFGLVAEGRGRGALAGQRMLTLSLSKSAPFPICCSASARGGAPGVDAKLDELGLGGVTVSGLDTIPAGWGGTCSSSLEDIPGLEWQDAANVEVKDGAVLTGDPALVEDATIDSASLFDWGAYGYDSLTNMATNMYTGGATLEDGQIAPTESSPGVCGVSDVDNWGAPENPSHSCFGHFPIIYSSGDLRIRDGVGAGQGILLVDGNLRIEDTFNFYGAIFVQGEVRLEDAVVIYGGIVSGGRLRVENGATLRYSQCAVNRASANASVTKTQRLGSRSWGEVMR